MTAALIVDVYEGDLDGKPDWGKLAAAGPPWHGAIVKASEGLTYHPAWFGQQWQAIKQAGGDRYARDWFRGAYHYLRIAEDPVAQAELYLHQVEVAGGWGDGDLWPMLDVEAANNPDKPGHAAIEDCVSAWAAKVKQVTGRAVMLYGNVYLWENGVTSTMGCETLIVAHYAETLPPAVYERIGWSWSTKPDVEPPTLWGWQGVGDGLGHWANPIRSPIGDVDITAVVAADGGESGLAWTRRNLLASKVA
jgi:GH25 family lysozyme M1 (1,4-beta-N-acetylmuramidase)